MKQPLIFLLYVLTFTAGALDAVSILGLGGVFCSLMTGNTVLIGLSLGGGAEAYSAFRSSLAIAFFLVGAILAGRWSKYRMGASRRAWLLPIGCLESGLLLAAAATGYLFTGDNGIDPSDNAVLAMIGFTAMAMGLRNATVTRISVADLKTTILTLTLTSLAADSPLGENKPQNAARRILSVVLLCAGASTGALLYNKYGVVLTLIVAAVMVLSSHLLFSLTSQAQESHKKQT